MRILFLQDDDYLAPKLQTQIVGSSVTSYKSGYRQEMMKADIIIHISDDNFTILKNRYLTNELDIIYHKRYISTLFNKLLDINKAQVNDTIIIHVSESMKCAYPVLTDMLFNIIELDDETINRLMLRSINCKNLKEKEKCCCVCEHLKKDANENVNTYICNSNPNHFKSGINLHDEPCFLFKLKNKFSKPRLLNSDRNLNFHGKRN